MKKYIMFFILIMLLFSITLTTGISIQMKDDLIFKSYIYYYLNQPNMKNNALYLEDSFSWKNHNGYDWTTPVQDQMKEGPCWAFAAIGALESVIKIRENAPLMNIDLSEQYILSCLPDAGSMQGGSVYRALLYMMETSYPGNRKNGAIPEHCFPYQASDLIDCGEKSDDWDDYLIPIDGVGYWYSDGSSSDRQLIQAELISKGPIATSITVTEDFRDWGYEHNSPNDYYPYPGSVGSTNHAILIVGWTDDSSIPHGGYWICKNSWEQYWGYEGFFNIEYGSLKVDSTSMIWVDYDPSFNLKPIGITNDPIIGSIGDTFTFDASNSYDPDGDNIVSYKWDFDDGSTGLGESVSHTFNDRGIYMVSLTVTDEYGKHSTVKTTALVDAWEKDDTWTFKSTKLKISSEDTGLSFEGSLSDVILKIVDESSNFYSASISGDLDGSFEIENNNIIFSGSFQKTKIDGTIVFRKTDFALKDITGEIKGTIIISNDLLPFNIPFTFGMSLDSKIEPELAFTSFPLEIGNRWGNPETTISVDGTIKSIYFRIANFVNNIAKIGGNQIIPSEYAQLLPVIDISELFEVLEIENPMIVAEYADTFRCIDYETITVDAGTFDTYKIFADLNYGSLDIIVNYYYAPDVANIVKFSIESADSFSFSAELTSTSITH